MPCSRCSGYNSNPQSHKSYADTLLCAQRALNMQGGKKIKRNSGSERCFEANTYLCKKIRLVLWWNIYISFLSPCMNNCCNLWAITCKVPDTSLLSQAQNTREEGGTDLCSKRSCMLLGYHAGYWACRRGGCASRTLQCWQEAAAKLLYLFNAERVLPHQNNNPWMPVWRDRPEASTDFDCQIFSTMVDWALVQILCNSEHQH